MKKNSTVTSGIVFFIFILSIAGSAHAALAEFKSANVLGQGTMIQGTAQFFSQWLKPKIKIPAVKIITPEKQKMVIAKPISELDRQLNSYRLFSASA